MAVKTWSPEWTKAGVPSTCGIDIVRLPSGWAECQVNGGE
jgi:hypothetical protein